MYVLCCGTGLRFHNYETEYASGTLLSFSLLAFPLVFSGESNDAEQAPQSDQYEQKNEQPIVVLARLIREDLVEGDSRTDGGDDERRPLNGQMGLFFHLFLSFGVRPLSPYREGP